MSGEFILNPNFRPWVGCFLCGGLLPAAKATFFNYEPATDCSKLDANLARTVFFATVFFRFVSISLVLTFPSNFAPSSTTTAGAVMSPRTLPDSRRMIFSYPKIWPSTFPSTVPTDLGDQPHEATPQSAETISVGTV